MASGLLTREQLEEARAAIRWSDGYQYNADAPPTQQQMIAKLIEMGRLNLWQAKQLNEGRTKFNLGPYKIVDSIGQGGMGQVFRAEHSVMGRVVAVKVLPRDKSTPEAVASFTREIRAQARLHHENLVQAFDAGHDGNVYYLVAEYVPGVDLRKLVRRHGSLPMQTAASIISQVAEGLEHAHQQGLIHRDVKPGNVLVTPDGQAKLSDLGLVGALGGNAEDDPRFGKIVGTADYLSPDHIGSPRDSTPAWDIYSLGCTLYYAVTAKVPFPGGSTADKIRAHCELRPLDPRRLNPDLSPEFVDVMADMLAKDPKERIQTAAQVVARLAPWVGERLPIAIDEEPVEASAGRPSRGPTLAAARGSTPRGATPDPWNLAETETSIPDVVSSVPNEEAQYNQASVATDSNGAKVAATSSTESLLESVSILRPLIVFVAAPVTLVLVLLLISLILERMF